MLIRDFTSTAMYCTGTNRAPLLIYNLHCRDTIVLVMFNFNDNYLSFIVISKSSMMLWWCVLSKNYSDFMIMRSGSAHYDALPFPA